MHDKAERQAERQAELVGARIVVTGGCGFIGSHLCQALYARGASRVVAIDSLRYGNRENLRGCDVEIVRHTLGLDDPAALSTALRGADYVFHLAAEKHNQSKESPRTVLRANIEGTHELLTACVDAGVRKVIFASSLYAYGRLGGAPARESETPRPTTVYGISKLAGEQLCAHFAAAHGLHYDVLRYFFIYGPRQLAGLGYKSVIVKNIEHLKADLPLTIVGDGGQALDYVYVEDAVDASIRAMLRDGTGQTMNIASGHAVSVRHLLQTLATVVGKDPGRRFLPADETAGTTRSGDPSLAATLLNWHSTTSLAEGLRRTYEQLL